MNSKFFLDSDYEVITDDAILYKINGGGSTEGYGISGAGTAEYQKYIASQNGGNSGNTSTNTSSSSKNTNTGTTTNNTSTTTTTTPTTNTTPIGATNNQSINISGMPNNSTQNVSSQAGQSVNPKLNTIRNSLKVANFLDLFSTRVAHLKNQSVVKKNEKDLSVIREDFGDRIIWSASYKRYPLSVYVPVEGVGIFGQSVIQTTTVQKNNGELTVSALANFPAKMNVDKVNFKGNVSLIINGREVENKLIQRYRGEQAIWDSNYDYLGTVKFDTLVPNLNNVSVKTDIDAFIGTSGSIYYVNYSPKTINLGATYEK